MSSIHDTTEADSIRLLLENHAEGLAEYLWDRPEAAVPTSGAWTLESQCGPSRFRIEVVFEPSGQTREQQSAAILAGDPNEVPEVRAAAAVVAAGGPGVAAAREALRGIL